MKSFESECVIACGGTIMKTRPAIAALAALLVGLPVCGTTQPSVAFEAESGILGSDFITGEDNGVTYISNTNNNVGFTSNRPQIPGRVATYNLTFPSVGTYELYARLRVGPGGANDDSFFYANGFGDKQEILPDDWIQIQGIENRGFANATNVVLDGGSTGPTVWKWVNLSQDTGTYGELPVTFIVFDQLTQTIQIGGREDGLSLDKFVFRKVGYPPTVADLDAVLAPEPPSFANKLSVPQFLGDGDFSVHYSGIPGHEYAAEWTDSLMPPATWTPLLTNTVGSSGKGSFTNTTADAQRFYRVSDLTPMDTNPPPLVYSVENTGAGFPAPPLPTIDNLPTILPLTDPFMWSATDPFNWTSPTGRSTNFTDWSHRRAEIKAEIEHYEIGPKPVVDPSMIFASYTSNSPTSGTLTVIVTNEVSGANRTLTLTCPVSLPAGAGPHPVIIGMNSPNGSINLGGRPIATIAFFHNQVTTYGNPQNSNAYYRLYENLGLNIDNTGQYSAWAWGVSRIIDGLYKLNGTLGSAQINLERIGVTGCSYAGKMALFSGALDERIALTIPQESGGGGAPNWRYSWQEETAGTVEGLGQTDHNWFKEDMFAFAGDNTAKLPYDHHELLAMVAPRALFVTGNPDYEWLSNPSCTISCRAVEQVYNTFGISDRFGFNIVGGHSHCATTAGIDAEIGAFLDKFLLGDTNVNTLIRTPASSLDFSRWIAWWGTTNPAFPGVPEDAYTITFEAECATVGTNWDLLADAQASNGRYATAKAGLQSLSSPPASSDDFITIPFSLTTNGNFAVFGRLNCPTADDDSFWVRMDDESFVLRNGLRTSGWQWRVLNSYTLTAGEHILTIGYREDGAKLDKISISTWPGAPAGTGEPAENICSP